MASMAAVKPTSRKLGLRDGCQLVGIFASSQFLNSTLNSLGAPPTITLLTGINGRLSIDAARMAYSCANCNADWNSTLLDCELAPRTLCSDISPVLNLARNFFCTNKSIGVQKHTCKVRKRRRQHRFPTGSDLIGSKVKPRSP